MSPDFRTGSPITQSLTTLSRAIFSAVSDPVFVVDVDLHIVAANEQAAIRFGHSASDDVVGLELLGLVSRLSRSYWRSEIENVIETRRADRFEDECEGLKFINTLEPVVIDGQVAGVVVYCRDVSELRRTSEDLRREQQRQIFFMESLPGIVFMVAEDGTIRFANRTFINAFGNPRGFRCQDFFTGVDPCPMHGANDVFDRLKQHDWEWAGPDDTIYHLYGRPMTDVDGKLVVIVLGIDVTDQRLAERRVQNAQRYQRAILDNIPDMAWLKDASGRYVAVNEAFARTVGLLPDDLVGKVMVPTFSRSLNEEFADREENVLNTGRTRTDEEAMHLGEDRRIWVETVRSPIADMDGRIIGVVGISRDITERKREVDSLLFTQAELEKRVGERTRELEQANENLRRSIERHQSTLHRLSEAKKRADEATRAKSVFLANMSHEIRTPLNVIMGMTEMLRQTDCSAGRNYAGMIHEAGQTLLTVINDILDFSKIEAHKLELERIDFDLIRLLDAVRAMHAVTLRDKPVRVELDCGPAVPRYVCGDPVRLRQIIHNLVANAVKFTPRGRIVISVGLDAQEATEQTFLLRFAVTDTGIGIPEDKRHAIFESFQQADDSTTREFGGTGLGLAICKRLATLMGGELDVRSEVGQGSTFAFTARFEPGDPDRALARERAENVQHEAGEGEPLTVLVADDSRLNRELLRESLTQRGHTVVEAANGREAVDALAGRRVDVVVMDIQMPRLDGLAATRELRSRQDMATPADVPVIALTAQTMTDEVRRIREAGVDRVVSKPVELNAFAALLAEATEPDAAKAPPASAEPTFAAPLDFQDAAGNQAGPPLFEREAALAKLAGSEKLLARMQASFLRDAPGDLAELEQAHAQGDAKLVGEIAHRIKGNAATIGAEACRQAALALEQAGRSGGGEIFGNLYETLRSETSRVLTALSEQGEH
jgi:PAS domain S-box-containing protein